MATQRPAALGKNSALLYAFNPIIYMRLHFIRSYICLIHRILRFSPIFGVSILELHFISQRIHSRYFNPLFTMKRNLFQNTNLNLPDLLYPSIIGSDMYDLYDIYPQHDQYMSECWRKTAFHSLN